MTDNKKLMELKKEKKFEFVTSNNKETIRGFSRTKSPIIKTEKQILDYCKRIAKVRKHILRYVKIGKKKIYQTKSKIKEIEE